MSLLVDRDYLVLSLRLAYLRKIDDHTGPRVLSVTDVHHSTHHDPQQAIWASSEASTSSLDVYGTSSAIDGDLLSAQLDQYDTQLNNLPFYARDSAVVVSGLNDTRYQPELTTLHSPKLGSDDLGEPEFWGASPASGSYLGSAVEEDSSIRRDRNGTSPGSLGYTTTIYGPGRTGALGMRVSGRRNTSLESRRKPPRKYSDISSKGDGGNNALVGRAQTLRRRSSRDKPMPRRVSDLSNTSRPPIEIASEESSRQKPAPIPVLEIQPSTYDSEEGQRKERRKSSLRTSYQGPESISADDLVQGRSAQEDERMPEKGSHKSLDNQAAPSSPTSSLQKMLPPPRPARRTRRAPSDLSTTDAQSEPSMNLSQTFQPLSPSRADSRSRSASVGFSCAPHNETGVSTDPELVLSRPTPGSLAKLRTASVGSDEPMRPSMDRTFSDLSLFSLASPHVARRRGMSERSGQSDNQSWARPEQQGRDRAATFGPLVEHEEAAPHDNYSTFPSPILRARAASDPHDANQWPREGATNLAHSVGALTPLENVEKQSQPSEGVGTSGASNMSPAVVFDTSAPEPLSSTHSAAPITSALGLEVEDVRSPDGDVSFAMWDDSANLEAEEPPSTEKIHRTLKPQDVFADDERLSFEKVDTSTIQQHFDSRSNKSALSTLLHKLREGPPNVFAQMYKGVAGSSVALGGSISIEVLFPFSAPGNLLSNVGRGASTRSGAIALHPESKSMQLSVRKDATMEELIGYSLYCYVEEGWVPHLDNHLPANATENERKLRLSTLAWTMRLVEFGEVDDDYPALDRTLVVGRFGADELAVCEATKSQIEQNRAAASALEQRSSKQPLPPTETASLAGTTHRTRQPGVSARMAAVSGAMPAGSLISVQGTPIFTSSVLGDRQGTDIRGSSAPIFLRVLVTPNSQVRYKTTLQVTSDRYLADVLETICKRRDLGSSDKWAFVVPDKDIIVPLDRTVESLQGNYDLALIRRKDLGEQLSGALTSQSTNPNASIFKRVSHQSQPRYHTAAKQLASTFKSYTVNRRLPAFLGRHERVLTIDGDWLHIIPTDARALHTHAVTASFPASAILSCTQSRLPSLFKLFVARETDQKRYDFEAESSKVAGKYT